MHLKFFVGLCTVSLVSSQSFSFGIGFDNASPSAVSSGFPFQTTAFEPQRSQTNSRGASRKASESATRPGGDRQSSQNIRESISSFIFSGLDDEPAQTSARQSTSHRSREQPKQTVQQRQSTQEQTLPEVNRQRVSSVRSRQQTQRQTTVTSQPHNQQQFQHPQVQRQQQLQVVQQQQQQPQPQPQPQPQQQQQQQPQPQQDPQVQHQQQQQLQIEQLQQIQQQQQQQQKQQLQQQKDLLQQQIQRQQHPKTHRQQQQQQNFQPQQFEEISRVPTARKTETQTISSLSSPFQSAPVQQVNEVNIGKSPCARGNLGHECRMNLKNAALSCTSGKCHQCQQCGSVPVNDWITCCRDHFLCCRPLARSCQRCDQPLLTSFCNVAFGKCK